MKYLLLIIAILLIAVTPVAAEHIVTLPAPLVEDITGTAVEVRLDLDKLSAEQRRYLGFYCKPERGNRELLLALLLLNPD